MLSKRQIKNIGNVIIHMTADIDLLANDEYRYSLIIDLLDDVAGFESLNLIAKQEYLNEISKVLDEIFK